MVGTSGSEGTRFDAVTPSARTLPVRMCPIEPGRLSNSTCTSPARRSVSAGALSRMKSKGSLSYSVALMALLGPTKTTVYPSGAELSADCIPTLPPAPTLFSTMNCCPRISDRYCPMTRATMSFGPPAEKHTIQRTGRIGYPCADAACNTAGRAATPAAKCRIARRVRFMAFPPQLNRNSYGRAERIDYAHFVKLRKGRVLDSVILRECLR